MSTRQPAMVLPPVDRHGEVDTRHPSAWLDPRIPDPIGRYSDDQRPVRPLGYWQGDDRGPCAGEGTDRQRHLFDVLSTHGPQGYDDQDRPVDVEFRMRLTCVRCGLVLAMNGQSHSEEDSGVQRSTRIDPVPLQAGPLLAQQVRRHAGWGGDVDADWTVYRDGQVVGSLGTARGQRGRRFYAGRLHDDGDTVLEGATPMAALKKLARRAEALAAPAGR